MEPAGIVIGATPDGSGWCDDLVRSIRTDYPVTILSTWEFELSAISRAAEQFKEFVFLPYSTEVKDNSLFELVFEHHTGHSVSLCQTPNAFGMYLGKYLSRVVQLCGVPKVNDKREAVAYEGEWCRRYAALGPWCELGDLPASNVFVERHGRKNMVVENRWLRRYKGCWDGNSLRLAAKRSDLMRRAVTC